MKTILTTKLKDIIILTILAFTAACGGSNNDNATQSTTPQVETQDPNSPVTFKVEGTDAIMIGLIDSSTITTVSNLIANNPEVVRIIMQDVPGSIDDIANIAAARLIRESGKFTTHVPSDGIVASGGTDFFLAGTHRTAQKGAQFGVHSWSNGTDVIPKDLPRTDTRHKIYLDYYQEMGIPEDFYWFTLEAAPASSIYNMTEAELNQYNILTEALEQ